MENENTYGSAVAWGRDVPASRECRVKGCPCERYISPEGWHINRPAPSECEGCSHAARTHVEGYSTAREPHDPPAKRRERDGIGWLPQWMPEWMQLVVLIVVGNLVIFAVVGAIWLAGAALGIDGGSSGSSDCSQDYGIGGGSVTEC